MYMLCEKQRCLILIMKKEMTMTFAFTQVDRVEAALKAGKELTAKQISAQFGVASPRSVISAVRQRGNAVYLNERFDSKGRKTSKYRIGTPSAALVAAGYRALAAGI